MVDAEEEAEKRPRGAGGKSTKRGTAEQFQYQFVSDRYHCKWATQYVSTRTTYIFCWLIFSKYFFWRLS